jgi:hypothetical protein
VDGRRVGFRPALTPQHRRQRPEISTQAPSYASLHRPPLLRKSKLKGILPPSLAPFVRPSRSHSRSPAVFEHSSSLTQRERCTGPPLDGGLVSRQSELVVFDASDVLNDSLAVSRPQVDPECEVSTAYRHRSRPRAPRKRAPNGRDWTSAPLPRRCSLTRPQGAKQPTRPRLRPFLGQRVALGCGSWRLSWQRWRLRRARRWRLRLLPHRGPSVRP